MFEDAPLPRRRTSTAALLIGGALPLLGYSGLPWWLGWPAYTVVAFAESALSLSDRTATWRVAIFAVAVLVNVLAWTAVVRIVVAIVTRRSPSRTAGGR